MEIVTESFSWEKNYHNKFKLNNIKDYFCPQKKYIILLN